MPTPDTGHHLLVLPGISAASAARARQDAMALRARGHVVTWTRDLADVRDLDTPPVVILAYSPAGAVAAAQADIGPVLHLSTGPATLRAAGEPPAAIEAAHAATLFHAAPSPAAQREILLTHGGRCWHLPPGVAPAVAGAPGGPRSPDAPLRVVVMDPYEKAPIDWLERLVPARPADVGYAVHRVPVAMPGWERELSGAHLALVPSVGTEDGSPWLAAMIAGLGVPVLVTDAEPHHGLLPPGEGSACFVPPGDVPATLAALERLARDAEVLERIRAAGGTIVRHIPLFRRVEALEGALREIVEAAPGTGTGGWPASLWLPRAHGSITESRYTFAARMVRARRVLDVTCGDGRGALHLADAGAARVLGCGPAPSELGAARRRLGRDGRVSLLGTRPHALALASRSVDLVIALDGIDRIEDPWAFLREAARVLVRNGSLLLALDNPRDGADPALGDGVSSLERIRELLDRVFGRVTPFAERIGPFGITFRGETVDAERDAGWILLATRPTRLPTGPERRTDTAGAPVGRRHAA